MFTILNSPLSRIECIYYIPECLYVQIVCNTYTTMCVHFHHLVHRKHMRYMFKRAQTQLQPSTNFRANNSLFLYLHKFSLIHLTVVNVTRRTSICRMKICKYVFMLYCTCMDSRDTTCIAKSSVCTLLSFSIAIHFVILVVTNFTVSLNLLKMTLSKRQHFKFSTFPGTSRKFLTTLRGLNVVQVQYLNDMPEPCSFAFRVTFCIDINTMPLRQIIMKHRTLN